MKIKKRTILLAVFLILLAAAGSIYINFIWKTSIKTTEEQALRFALTAEAGFQTDMINKMEAVPEDIDKPEYSQIKNSLLKLASINQDIRFAYIYIKKDGKIYFLADSKSVTSEDYSPPGQEYGEADSITFQALEQDAPIVTEPTKDRWGNWVSILIPIKDYKSGKIIAVFGMDYPAESWKDSAKIITAQISLVVLCLILLFVALNFILLRNRYLKNDKIKSAELNDKLVEKEELFRTLFEQAPLGIAFGNSSANISDANAMYQKILGRSKEELSKLSWIKITHPDDLQEDMNYFNKFVTGEINGYTMVKRYMKPDDTFVWVNMIIAPLHIRNKQHLSHLCIVEDISERMQTISDLKEVERSNAMLLSNLHGMAYRCNYDRNWTMQFISEGCYALTGYRPDSFLHNNELSFNDIISPYYKDLLWNKWGEVLKKRKIFKEEYSITTAFGELKWVYEQGQGVYDSNGEVTAIEGMIIDISDRKKQEEEIKFLNYHDILTGLFNRSFFEVEKLRLDTEDQYPLSIILGDINGLKLINDTLGHDEGDRLINTISVILKSCCRENDILARTGGDEFSLLLPQTSSEVADKIVKKIDEVCEQYKNKMKEESYYISISLGCATKTNSDEKFTVVLKDAEDSMYRHKLLQNRSLHSSIISSMKMTLFEKNQRTEEHAQRLIEISNKIGHEMNLEEKQLNELELLSTLHDIGKIGINDNILNKPGKLTPAEWVEMRKHPEIGYRIAMSTPELSPIADYILCHHERWDGAGYPQGLKGEEIPLLSRILAIADAYDAMTADRPYRKAMTEKAAIEEIRKCSGTQFDPNIAEIFLTNIV